MTKRRNAAILALTLALCQPALAEPLRISGAFTVNLRRAGEDLVFNDINNIELGEKWLVLSSKDLKKGAILPVKSIEHIFWQESKKADNPATSPEPRATSPETDSTPGAAPKKLEAPDDESNLHDWASLPFPPSDSTYTFGEKAGAMCDFLVPIYGRLNHIYDQLSGPHAVETFLRFVLPFEKSRMTVKGVWKSYCESLNKDHRHLRNLRAAIRRVPDANARIFYGEVLHFYDSTASNLLTLKRVDRNWQILGFSPVPGESAAIAELLAKVRDCIQKNDFERFLRDYVVSRASNPEAAPDGSKTPTDESFLTYARALIRQLPSSTEVNPNFTGPNCNEATLAGLSSTLRLVDDQWRIVPPGW